MEERRYTPMLDAFKGAEIPESAGWASGHEGSEPTEPVFTTEEARSLEDGVDAEHEKRIDSWMNDIKQFIRNIDTSAL